jgi:glutamyl-Q tRNA(Asp) synthetase
LSCIGRFAPSPTGPLHFGSLLAALASYLDMRSRNGKWLLRIEDLDPPREQPGAAGSILRTLDAFGLHWDGPVAYQSQRLEYYQDALEQLLRQGAAYRCNCSRKQLKTRGVSGLYDGHCLRYPPPASASCAIRVIHPESEQQFQDRIQGVRRYQWPPGYGDFVVFRRDGLFAYQLAVVVDDAAAGVTDILRGSDLIDETPHQIALQALLGYPMPAYAHIPVITNPAGQKLSKQNLAPAIDPSQRQQLLLRALSLLGQKPPTDLATASRDELLSWAVTHWNIAAVPGTLSLCESET